MNEKQVAARLRDIADRAAEPDIELRLLADELDPPRPEPGTPIHAWLIDNDYHGPRVEMMGWSRPRGIAATKHGGTIHTWDEIYRWEPLNILGPRQVAVDVPPVAEWPEWANQIVAAYRNSGSGENGIVTDIINRTEANRMEASDE